MTPIAPIVDLHAVRAHVRRYAGADDREAWLTLATTAVGHVLTMALFVAGWWPVAVLLGAGVYVRTFVILHDCCHRIFFRRATWNARLAKLLQVPLFASADVFAAGHLAHHRVFGNLGVEDGQDQILFTRQQFEAMPAWQRACWRFARAPVVFFPLMPFYLWIGQYAIVHGNRWIWSGLGLHTAFAWFVGPWYVLALYLHALAGAVLFHLQHAVGDGYRRPAAEWRHDEAALRGSTWLPIARPFTWFTLGVEFHHIHHFQASVPCYRLAACHAEAPAGLWDGITRGTLRNCLHALGNVMWDTEQRRLVHF